MALTGSDAQRTYHSMISIVFVCAGNICRSPAMAAVFEKMLSEKNISSQFNIDSCGTTAYYLGCNADERMRKAAEKRGVHIHHRAKLFDEKFFDIFDYIIASDRDILKTLEKMTADPHQKSKLRLAGSFSKKHPMADIPDPYYGGEKGFDHVMDMIEDACKGLLEHLGY
jgi:protein-tyrosine phosphatase